jgi:hypothetical protein
MHCHRTEPSSDRTSHLPLLAFYDGNIVIGHWYKAHHSVTTTQAPEGASVRAGFGSSLASHGAQHAMFRAFHGSRM